MTTDDLKVRFQDLAVSILELSDRLPSSPTAVAIAKQISRSGTSPGTNYRAALRGKSTRDFINKLKMVEEELDETLYWLEILGRRKYLAREEIAPAYRECRELLKIIVATIKTARYQQYLARAERHGKS